MEEKPFGDLKISSSELLSQVAARVKCPQCNKSRKYYCFLCGIRVHGADVFIPTVKLPVKIDIIRHPVEETGKNTAIHAKVISPDDVTMYSWPNFPEYEDKSKLIVVYPSKESITLPELVEGTTYEGHTPSSAKPVPHGNTGEKQTEDSEENGKSKLPIQGAGVSERSPSSDEREEQGSEISKCDNAICSASDMSSDRNLKTAELYEQGVSSFGLDENCDIENKKRGLTDADNIGPDSKALKVDGDIQPRPRPPFDRVIFLDSTWHYSNRIGKDERLKGVTQIELKTETTKYWRYQHKKPDTYLSTIEAIYYFLREYHELFSTEDYDGQYDDLLFLFVFMYERIRQETKGGVCIKAFQTCQAKEKDL